MTEGPGPSESVLLQVQVPVAHGALEALLRRQAAPRFAALVCHPHPQRGGSMQDVRAYRVATALARAGGSTLRFNFRGVGDSTGEWDEGRGELEDAAAALAFLAAEVPGVPLWVAGFSFGAWVGARLAAREGPQRVERLLCVGLPVRLFDFEALARVRVPTALVQGEEDEFGAPGEVVQAAARQLAPSRLFVVPGTDHLAVGRLPALEAVLTEAVAWLAPEPAAPGGATPGAGGAA